MTGVKKPSGGFNPDDFDVLAGVELTHFWFVARRRLLIALAAAYAPGARRFLEVGRGSGVSRILHTVGDP